VSQLHFNLGVPGTFQPSVQDLHAQPWETDAEMTTSAIPERWLLSGDRRTRSKVLGKTDDKLAYVMLWECGSARFKWQYGKDEFLIIISGEAYLVLENGRETRFGPSDVGFFPAGSTATWRIPDHCRKIAILKPSLTPPVSFFARACNKVVVWAGLGNEPGL
jgi:hypothetical protein